MDRLVLPLVFALARASCSEQPLPATETNTNTAAQTSGGTSVASASSNSNDERPIEIAARHLLVMHRNSQSAPPDITRTRDEALARAREARDRARAGEDFVTLVKQYTDEPGGAERGGALPRFHRGQMVPAFEQAAFALKPREISDVVETEFGYHVILRTE